jgi:predicted RNase H-like nuclease (RuvC/YqgF family)
MDYIERLEKIIQRAEKFSKEAALRQASLEKAQEEVQRLKLLADNQAKTIEDLNNKIKIIKLAESIGGGTDTAELKRKINEYIREIDNSIALLND